MGFRNFVVFIFLLLGCLFGVLVFMGSFLCLEVVNVVLMMYNFLLKVMLINSLFILVVVNLIILDNEFVFREILLN